MSQKNSDPAVMAQRLRDALNDERVTTATGFDGFDSPLQVGLDTFAADPKVHIAGNIVMFVIPGGAAVRGATWGSRLVGGYLVVRGADSIAGNVELEIGSGDGRGFVSNGVDSITGSTATTDGIFFVADIGVGVYGAYKYFKYVNGKLLEVPRPKTGTVWDSITPTQPVYPGTEVPRSFTLTTSEGSVWVHGNATEHLAEYAYGLGRRGISLDLTRVTTQSQLTSLQAAIEAASQGGLRFGKMYRVGGWELIFSPPRQPGQLPALIHALYGG